MVDSTLWDAWFSILPCLIGPLASVDFQVFDLGYKRTCPRFLKVTLVTLGYVFCFCSYDRAIQVCSLTNDLNRLIKDSFKSGTTGELILKSDWRPIS